MSNLRIAIIGANGQLGTDIVKACNADETIEISSLTHQDIDITNKQLTRKVFDKINPHVIINTAAYHRVDDCETQINKAFLVNAYSEKNLAEYCAEKSKTLVYISTDYVFGTDTTKKTPYKETDAPGPLNVYGLSKLTGEYFTRYTTPKHFVIRSSGLYGVVESTVKKGNFVETMLRLAKERNQVQVVTDQILTPTYTYNLAQQILTIIKTDYYGLYHATAEGECSWYEFAKEIFELTHTKVKLIPVTTDKFPTLAKRPFYSALENYLLKKNNLNIMIDWQTGLKNYLAEKGYL